MRQLVQDLRYSARMLRRSPVFSATAILTLALGIGANAALFSVLDALLVRSLPVQRPEELVQLLDEDRDTWGYQLFERVRGATLFAGVSATRETTTPAPIEEDGTPLTAQVHAVSGEYFDLLGVKAQVGRSFNRAEASASDAVAVISDAYWRRHYASDPAAVGRRVHYPYSRRNFTIVGIAPPQFRGTLVDAPTDIWIPLEQREPPGSLLYTQGRWLRVLARLGPGVTPAQAAAEASALAGRRVRVEPGHNGFSPLRGRFAVPLVLLQIVVGLVLLIACANLANLMLVRATARERELAIRRAVGASSGRLVRQLATESLFISTLGGAMALAVAYWLNAAILGFLPPESAPAVANLSFHLSARMLGFGVAVSLLTTLLFGLVPAYRATRAASGATLKVGGGMGRGRSRLTNRALLVCEIALCAFLVIGAGLFVRTLRNLWSQDLGFAAGQVLVADIQVPPPLRPRQQEIFEELRARAASIPGVRVAALTRIGQLSGGAIEFNIHVEGQVAQREGTPEASEQRVSPGFLAAMGTGLRAGRDFDDRDTATSPPVALVNEAFVRQVLPGGRPLGQRFKTAPDAAVGIEIVGVVEDSKWIDLREKPRAMFYRPIRQVSTPAATLVVRAAGDLDAIAQRVLTAAKALDTRITIGNLVPFTEVVNRTLTTERLVAQVSTAFALLALLMACVGVYGVLAYGVAQRTREIGVHIALGATRSAVRWLVLRESLGMLAVGFLIGVAAALAAMRVVASMLFGVTFYDPSTLAVAFVLLVTVLCAAAYLPARRATSIDPLTALRAE